MPELEYKCVMVSLDSRWGWQLAKSPTPWDWLSWEQQDLKQEEGWFCRMGPIMHSTTLRKIIGRRYW